MLNLPGFDFETSEDVRTQALGDVATLPARLNNRGAAPVQAPTAPAGLQRLADVPIYAVDAVVRRASSLQLTADARAGVVSVGTALWNELNLSANASVRATQGSASVVLPVRLDASLAPQVVRLPAGLASTALGSQFGAVRLEKV